MESLLWTCPGAMSFGEVLELLREIPADRAPAADPGAGHVRAGVCAIASGGRRNSPGTLRQAAGR